MVLWPIRARVLFELFYNQTFFIHCRLTWWIFTSALDGLVNIHHYSPPLKWVVVNYFRFSIFDFHDVTWNPKIWRIKNPWARKRSKLDYCLSNKFVTPLLFVSTSSRMPAWKHNYQNSNFGRPDSTLYLMGEECKIFHPLCRAGYMSTWMILQCLYMKLKCGNCEHRWHIHQYLLIWISRLIQITHTM